jgi:MoxR-like ATPase
MEEHQLTIDGVTTPLPAPFLVLATQNPIELEGTFPLPEAQLDRFFLRIRMGYPDAGEEDAILLRFEAESPLTGLEPVVEASELVRLSASLPAVHVEPAVREYVVRLTQATRAHPAVELGASPRATLALFRASRALAAVRGRDRDARRREGARGAGAQPSHHAQLAVAPARPRRREPGARRARRAPRPDRGLDAAPALAVGMRSSSS